MKNSDKNALLSPEFLCSIDARLSRIEAILTQHRPRPDPANLDLVDVLADCTKRDWFTARELWDQIDHARRICEITGEPIPYLVRAMNAECVTNAKSMGWWLSYLEPDLIERSDKGRDGLFWKFL